MSWLSLSPVEAAQVAKAGGTAPKVTKDAKGGTTFEVEDTSELARFAKDVNQEQSAWTGVGHLVTQGRLRLLAKELGDLADAADDAGVRQRRG